MIHRISDLTFTDIIRLNREFHLQDIQKYKIGVISNIVVTPLKDILELSLKSAGVNAFIEIANYDNILQEAERLNHHDCVIIIWEAANFIDNFEYKSNIFDDSEYQEFINTKKNEIDFLYKILKETRLKIINKFSAIGFNNHYNKKNNFDHICNYLNSYICEKYSKIFNVIDIEKIIASLSIRKSFDYRMFRYSKSLFSIEFLKKYIEYICPLILSVNGKSKKALIFDCDNTLWKGIVGEDSLEKIEIFQEIQYLAVELSKKGVIIGLCSKNNYDDVEDFINGKPEIILKDEFIAIKAINWNNKTDNLRNIALDLNIGLDSIIYIDDSSFEIELIKKEIPEILALKKPAKYYEYINLLRNLFNLFGTSYLTEEDLYKTKFYKSNLKRQVELEKHSGIETFLETLGLEIYIYINDQNKISRMAQMTQKTNQFNMTTKRYSESDMEKFFSNDYKTICFAVRDKFGDNGVTGLIILKINHTNCEIDTFLMSCRIIGRNIEFAFFDWVINYLKKIGITKIIGKYIRTPKNNLVEEFYERLSFVKLSEENQIKTYELNCIDYIYQNKYYIKLHVSGD